MLPVETDVTTVKKLIDDGAEFTLLDCREVAERELVRIEPSKLIPMGELPQRFSELGQPTSHVVVYCHHGGRSLMVAEWLRSQGYESAQSMAGGIDRWATQIDTSCPRY